MAQQIYERVVHTIADHLKSSGLTQEELADRCGMTQPTIQRIISGKRGENLPFKTILNLALALDIDLSSILSPHSCNKQEKIKTLLAEINKIVANE